MNKKRQTGIELLRIIAMFAIVMGHFIEHGGGFTNHDVITDKLYISEQLFEALGAFKVNVFIIITGYFLIDRPNIKYKDRLSKLWKSEIIYSVLIMIIVVLCGVHVSLIEIVKSIIPTITYRYWFITLYFVLILFTPALNRVVSSLNKKQYKNVLYVIIGVTCVWQTIMPFATTIDDNRGYSILWFVALYVLGGYIKKFGLNINIGRIKLTGLYVLCTILQLAYTLFWQVVQGKSNMIINIPYYNSIFVLAESVILLKIFMSFNFNTKTDKVINLIASSVIGVYLISDNPLIRGLLYNNIFDVSRYYDKGIVSILSVVIMSIIVFAICLCIDMLMNLIRKYLIRR